MASPSSPQCIGRYEILGELGKGAMGVVYKARDPNIGRLVALKTMRLDVHGMEANEMLLRFKNEARAAGVLNHSNIVTIYDAGEHEGLFYIAMEFIEGTTLQKTLNEEGIVPIEQVLELSRQICSALDYAHSHKIVHRDIKPANIMIEPDGRVKIMDFGIAKYEGTQLTTAGQVVGTPNYMSPEQVKGRPLDGRSDLWSFGVILYEMVTGEKPFTGQNVTTIIYKIVNENPIPPKELDASVHPGLSAVIQRALAKNPEQRYQKGADLVHHLINYKSIGVETASLPQDAHTAHVPPPAPAPAAKATPAAAAAKPPAPSAPKPPATAPAPAASKAATPAPAKPPQPAAAPPPAVAKASAKPPVPPPAHPAAAPAPVAASPTPRPAAAPPAAHDDETLVAGSHEPSPESVQGPARAPAKEPAAKLASAAAAAKAAMPQFTTNQWLLIAVGVLALLMVVIVMGVYRSEKAMPGGIPAATAPTPTLPAAQPAASQPAAAAPETAEEPADAGSKGPAEMAKLAKPRAKSKPPVEAAAAAPEPPKPAPINGSVRIISNPPGAKVEIDGWSEPTWLTPFNSPNLSAGQHKIVLSKAGFATEAKTVEVTAGNQAIVATAMRPATAPSRIEVTSDPAGASILLDGKPIGRQTPALIEVSKGEHTIALHKLGYVDASVPTRVGEGETAHVSQALKSGGSGNPFGKLFGGGIPEGMGALQVKSKPKGATVTINGETAPKTTPFKIVVGPGTYMIVVSLDGYQAQTQSLTVEKGKTANLELELRK